MRKFRPKGCSCLLLLVALCAYLSSCVAPPSAKEQTVANPDSKLLDVLMKESDFVGDWYWADKQIWQQGELPTAENHQLVESALSGYGGGYSSDRIYVSIWHILKRYEHQPPPIVQSDIAIENEPGDQTFKMAFAQVGQSIASECLTMRTTRGTGPTACKIAVNYNHTRSVLFVTASERMNIGTLQKIIDGLMVGIDRRIQNTGN